MREFIKKHDEEERKKSTRRMSKMSENEKRRTSMKYRRQSTTHKPPASSLNVGYSNGTGVPGDVSYVADSNGKLQQNSIHNGSPSVNMMKPIGEDNEAYHKEIPVYYQNKAGSDDREMNENET